MPLCFVIYIFVPGTNTKEQEENDMMQIGLIDEILDWLFGRK